MNVPTSGSHLLFFVRPKGSKVKNRIKKFMKKHEEVIVNGTVTAVSMSAVATVWYFVGKKVSHNENTISGIHTWSDADNGQRLLVVNQKNDRETWFQFEDGFDLWPSVSSNHYLKGE